MQEGKRGGSVVELEAGAHRERNALDNAAAKVDTLKEEQSSGQNGGGASGDQNGGTNGGQNGGTSGGQSGGTSGGQTQQTAKPAVKANSAADAKAKAAAAEAARQGKYSSKLPKVTITKPVAAKKAITVKWKKLTKKKQKKVGKIEIWVCPNKKFGPKDTVMKQVSKKKASYKVKKLGKKKRYYVKVRAIKMVKGVKTVGKWSKVKKVKTK